ncbi:MAG TPA: patatin-like phospholipase family protein [Microlunatus sp.]
MTSRALLLAGGGLKIAFQAGVLQVWLDELRQTFDQADAVSAATFNLAMICSGQDGTTIADHWRAFRPLRAISPSARALTGESLLTLNRLRANILPTWSLDWTKINTTPLSATFNVYNFTKQRVEAIPSEAMTEQLLLAAASLPTWFPPVTIDDDTYVDAIHALPTNLPLVLDRGADELWIIWTTSTAGVWRAGYLSQYFQIFEEATNSRLRAWLADIEGSNQRHARGEQSAYGRHITVRLLAAEVPLHYLLNFRRRPFLDAVDLGVRTARAWSHQHLLYPAGQE